MGDMMTVLRMIQRGALAAMVLAAGSSCRQEIKGDARPVIAGIIFQEDQFMRIVHIGMRAAASEHGAVLLEANSYNRPDREIELVNTYITRRVDGIAITPLSAAASVTALKRAHERGIRVVTYNSPLNADFPVSYINSSQTELGAGSGRAARRYILENLAERPAVRIATLGFKALLPEISDERVNGFLAQLRDLPQVQVVAQQDAWLTEDAIKRAGDILTANPEVDILFGANDGGTVGAVMAVRNAGRAGNVAVFGIDASEQIADFLLSTDGILQAVTGQQPYQIGYMSVELLVQSIRGEPVPGTVVVPGVTLTRADPGAIHRFKQDLRTFTE
jgi:ABC-type sugar transport system substrate-binding protein